MPVMEVDLEQLLKTVEQLNPAELAILAERIHLSQHSVSVKISTEIVQEDEPNFSFLITHPQPPPRRGLFLKVWSLIKRNKEEVNEFFTFPFNEYLALSDEDRECIQLSVYQSKKEWIDNELERRGASWLLVCGGEVVESSETLRDYPSREKLMTLGEERGVVPFVFVKAPLIEEESAPPRASKGRSFWIGKSRTNPLVRIS